MSVIGFIEESFVSIPQELAQLKVLLHPLLKTHTDIDIILLVTSLDIVTLSNVSTHMQNRKSSLQSDNNIRIAGEKLQTKPEENVCECCAH